MLTSMELLAPAGDLKIFKSAINAGADAVYFGGDFFGARASAKNFSVTDAKNGLEYAHLRKKKAYLTVNTLLKNTEMEFRLYDFMKEYYEAGIDGVIVQDFGVFSFLKDHFPDLELHASTQMSLMSKYGAKFLKDAGAKRIVTARELSLKEIKDIHENVDVEIEAFVHGALCVCYSGNCLMSSFIGGRSGNRGYCAQPCRLPYELLIDKNQVESEGEKYYLSPKDLWGIRDLPKMLDAGVYSYKIEGRLKNEAYVTNVVSIYRKYMDLLLSEGASNYKVEEKDLKRLVDAGNRGGFTNLYFYEKNGSDLTDTSNSAFYQENKSPFVTDGLDAKTLLFGEFIAHVGEEMSFTLWDEGGNCVTVSRGVCEESKSKPTGEAEIKEKLSALGELPYTFGELNIHVDKNAFVPLKYVKSLRRDGLSAFFDHVDRPINEFTPLDEKKLQKQLFKEQNLSIRIGISKIEQLNPLKDVGFSYELVLNPSLWLKESNIYEIKKEHGSVYIELPVVIRLHTIDLLKEKIAEFFDVADGFYAASYDGLELLNSMGVKKDKIRFSNRLYTYSNRTMDAFAKIGYTNFFAPLELNEKELSHRINTSSELMVYGYVPLMYTANCISKLKYGCRTKENFLLYLRDRKQATFPVINQCEICTNIIYNSLPLAMFDNQRTIKNLHPQSLRMDFTVESLKEETQVLRLFEDIYINGQTKELPFRHTKGHLKRGVL